MGYFEEYDTSKLANLSRLVPEASALGIVTDYSKRKIGVIGKMLGTLVESGTLVPVQVASTGTLDVATTATGYVAYFDSTVMGTGTGSALKEAFLKNSVIYSTG